MKHPDYDRAFHETPEYIRSAIELGFKKGQRVMKVRHRITGTLSVAAAFVIILGVAAFGANQLAAPKPDNRVPGKPLAAPVASETATPEPTPTPTATPTAAPAPTVEPTLEAGEEMVEVVLDTVYYTDSGRYFHAAPNCSGMEGAIEGSVQDACLAGKESCPICLADWSFVVRGVPAPTELVYEYMYKFAEEEMEEAAYEVVVSSRPYYYTNGGKYYHILANCSGMQGASGHPLYVAVESGKRHCPVCIGDNVELYWLPVPENNEDFIYVYIDAIDANMDTYYHVNPECREEMQPSVSILRKARARGVTPCPVCLPVLNPTDDP